MACSCLSALQDAVRSLKREVTALYYASLDPVVGCMPKAIIAVALAYVLSPLDLIPDFIPVLGLVDDLIIVPALIWLALKLIPPASMELARARADMEPIKLSKHIGAATFFLLIWLACFEGAAAGLISHWPLAHAHKWPTYGVATVFFLLFVLGAVISESEDAMNTLCAYCGSTCPRCPWISRPSTTLAAPLLP